MIVDVFLHPRTTRTPTSSLVINCPKCGATHVRAETYTYLEKLYLLYCIPLTSSQSYWMVCPQCRATIVSKFPAYELQGLPPEQLAEFIRNRTSPIRGMLAIFAIVFAIFPGLGLIMTILAVLVNFKTYGWTRKLSFIGLALCIAAHILWLSMGIFSSHPSHRY